MQGTDVLIPLAEIAGVFVGFGALIAVRSGATMAVTEIDWMRYVLMAGTWVVIAALAPTVIGSYGVTGHGLWLACSLLALAVFVAMVIAFGFTPENRAVKMVYSSVPRRVRAAVFGSTVWVPAPALLFALVLVVLGLFPDQEPALYLTAVAIGLYIGAIALFIAVFWQGAREPGTAGQTEP